MNHLLERLIAFVYGCIEFRSSLTTSFYDQDLQDTYDMGRNVSHLCTFRYFEGRA